MNDAGKAIETSKTRIPRAISQNVFSPGDLVDVYRILAMCNSHGLIEQGRQIRRHPQRWIRLRRNPHLIIAPETASSENPGNDEASSSSTDSKQGNIHVAVHKDDNDVVNTDLAQEGMLATIPNAWVTQFPSICHICRSMESVLFASKCVDDVINEENAWLVCQQKCCARWGGIACHFS